ncbi:MAG: hypothetical protein ACFB11_06135 [Paracoccaceae bacterium]
MSDIEELERRISAAMDRIATGVGRVGETVAGAADLQTALDEEKLANAQLMERVRKLSTRQQEADARLQMLDTDLQRLRQANADLRAANDALRKANAEGVGDPNLINQSIMAELEALRAARAADIAEAESIIGALAPLLEAADKETQDA